MTHTVRVAVRARVTEPFRYHGFESLLAAFKAQRDYKRRGWMAVVQTWHSGEHRWIG